jgi:hypothetical protein
MMLQRTGLRLHVRVLPHGHPFHQIFVRIATAGTFNPFNLLSVLTCSHETSKKALTLAFLGRAAGVSPLAAPPGDRPKFAKVSGQFSGIPSRTRRRRVRGVQPRNDPRRPNSTGVMR